MKGMTPTLFNWIFVVIAGGVIFLFVIKVIGVHADLSEYKVTAQVISDMEGIITGKSVSIGADSVLDIAEKPFVFSCQEPCSPITGCESSLRVQGSDIEIPTRTLPLFSSTSITSPRLYAFAKSWDVPFQASTFLYLVQPKQRILFPAACTGACARIYDQIPQRIKDQQIVVQGGAAAQSDVSVKTILFSSCPPTTEKTVCINTGQKELTFYPSGEVLPYYADETILAAIFSENAQTYECNMKKAGFDLDHVQDVLELKRQELRFWSEDDPYPNCRARYDVMQHNLSVFDTDFPFEGNILEAAETFLELDNTYIRRNSCPSLY